MNRKNELRCNECGAVFKTGDEIYLWEDGPVCGECFDGLCRDLSRIGRAMAMGCEVRICDDLTF